MADDEDSEYSYVYETDSEYEYYTDSEEEDAGDKPVEGTVVVVAPSAADVATTQSPQYEQETTAEVTDNNLDDDEDENEALKRHKQQLERFKPKIPAYVTDPEPCAFSDDPGTWIAWMEDQVNKEKSRRMEIIMQDTQDEDNDENNESPPDIEQEVGPNDNNETGTDDNTAEHTVRPDDIEESRENIVDNESAADNADNVEAEGSEWEWEYEDEEGEEVEVSMSLNLNSKSEDVVENEVEPVDNSCDTVDETLTDSVVEENQPCGETNAETSENVGRCSYDKQMSLPAENSKRRELVPKEMQEKINFIRRKKAEAASGQVKTGSQRENPTNNSSSDCLVEDTRRKLAFIKEHKKNITSPDNETQASVDNDLEHSTVEAKHDPNDPLDPETRRKLEFVRKNKKRSAPSDGISSSPTPAAPALIRQQSNPEGSRSDRPISLAEQYGDDSNLNDMLARIKTLRAERKQILQDMNAIKTAFSPGPAGKTSQADSAEVDRMDAADDGIETGESTPCNEISSPFTKDDNHHHEGKNSPTLTCPSSRRRSIDSGIGAKSSSSVQGGSPTDELDSISECSHVAENPGRKKISKEEKEYEEGVFHCFICGENLGKMTKGTVMHMGLEDGEPVCADALYLTDESKEKIMSIASTRTFSYEAKYELLDTMELETWDLEYDIPTGDLMDKVDAFLQDVEVQKQRDAEKFEAMRSGAIDEIFMEEFKDLLSEKFKDAMSSQLSQQSFNCEEPDTKSVIDSKKSTCDSSSQEHDIPSSSCPPRPPPPPAPAPPPSSSSSIPPPPAFNNVLQSIRDGETPKLKPTEVNDHSEIPVGQVIHKHIAPRVFTKDVRNLVKDISKDDHKRRLKKVKTNDKSAPFIPNDVEIYFYGGQNANKALPPPPLSKIKEEFNSSKRRYVKLMRMLCLCCFILFIEYSLQQK